MKEPTGKIYDEPEYDLLLGKRTYDIFAAFWPYNQDDPIGAKFQRINKYVLTHSNERGYAAKADNRSDISPFECVIKVMMTQRAGFVDTDFRARALSDDEVAAAVDEATKAGLPVAAHAHSDEGARAAVLAGVRTVEHGTLLGAATLALMRDKGTCFAPTLTFWVDMLEPGGEYDHATLAARAREMLPVSRAAVAQAIKSGVRVIAASDMRYDGVSDLRVSHEIAELGRSGMSPMAVLQSATSVSAACLGIGERTGAVKPGLEADLIVLDRDPIADLRAVENPVVVVNDGRIAVNKIGR
jgi:imidazolonepropionase-like amidohydrolase